MIRPLVRSAVVASLGLAACETQGMEMISKLWYGEPKIEEQKQVEQLIPVRVKQQVEVRLFFYGSDFYGSDQKTAKYPEVTQETSIICAKTPEEGSALTPFFNGTMETALVFGTLSPSIEPWEKIIEGYQIVDRLFDGGYTIWWIEDMRPITNKLSGTLKTIDFGNVAFLGDDQGITFSTLINKNKLLEKINISGSTSFNGNMSEDQTKIFLDNIELPSTLKHLELGFNLDDTYNLQKLAGLIQKTPILEALHIRGCSEKYQVAKDGMEDLSKILRSFSTLKEVSLNFNSDYTSAFVTTLMNPKIETMLLGGYDHQEPINAHSAGALGKAVNDSNLKMFCHTYIDKPVTTTAFFESLQDNNSLKTLFLTECELNDEGAKMFSSFIGKNTSLDSLELSKISISDEGVKMLAIGLLNRAMPLKTLKWHAKTKSTNTSFFPLTEKGTRLKID